MTYKSVVHMSAEVGGLNKGETPSLVPRPPPRFYLETKRSGRRPENEAIGDILHYECWNTFYTSLYS